MGVSVTLHFWIINAPHKKVISNGLIHHHLISSNGANEIMKGIQTVDPFFPFKDLPGAGRLLYLRPHTRLLSRVSWLSLLSSSYKAFHPDLHH